MRRYLLALLLWSPGAARAGSGTLTQAALEARVTELLPLVEAEAGRSFVTRPEVVLASPAMLAGVVYREQVHVLHQRTGLTEAQTAEAAQAAAGAVSAAFVGKYGFVDKKLYVVSEGVHQALAGRGFEPGLADEVLEVVLAHELAHALQDQHTDLGAVVTARPDSDAVMAVNCVVEGHAVWVHERVGERLGYQRAIEVVAGIHGYDPARPTLTDDPQRLYTSYVYGQGLAFVSWHAHDGGTDRLWTLLVEPPAASAMILEPATYATVADAGWSAATREAMRRARVAIGRRAWAGRDERVGDFELREQLADRSGGRSSAHTLADEVRAAWRSRATAGSPMLGVELQLIGFHDPRAARAYVDRMRHHAQRQLEALLPPVAGAVAGPGAVEPGVWGRVGRFDALASDVSAREAIVLEMDGARQELGTVWVARGSNVVQVVTVNRRVPDRRLARAIDRVFRTLD